MEGVELMVCIHTFYTLHSCCVFMIIVIATMFECLEQ